jgi:two-component system sensor kinase FixL
MLVSQADLFESEQRLSLAAGAASLGIWICDPVRDEFWDSHHWRTLFGFTRLRRLDATSVLQRVLPEDRPAVAVRLASRAMAQKVTRQYFASRRGTGD